MYGKLNANDLRIVLALLPSLEQERRDLKALIAQKPDRFAEHFLSKRFTWSHLYEQPFLQVLSGFLTVGGITDEVVQASRQNEPMKALEALVVELDQREWEGGKDGRYTPGDLLGYLYALMGNLDCLLVYGSYLCELVAEARQGKVESLFKAIRIDPSIVTGPTATFYISAAVVAGDLDFLAEVRKAMAGKTGRQAHYLRRFRLLMQILHETNALGLPTREIEELVYELGAYDDRPGASKNVSELIRKARRLKQNAISK